MSSLVLPCHSRLNLHSPLESGVDTQGQDAAEVIAQYQFSGSAAAGRSEGTGHEGVRQHRRIAVGIEVQHQEAVHRSENLRTALQNVIEALVQFPPLPVRATSVGGRVENDAVKRGSAADLTGDIFQLSPRVRALLFLLCVRRAFLAPRRVKNRLENAAGKRRRKTAAKVLDFLGKDD